MQGALKSVLLTVSAFAFFCSVVGSVDSGLRGIHNPGEEGNVEGTPVQQETFSPGRSILDALPCLQCVSCVFHCGLISNACTVVTYSLCVLGKMTLPLWASVSWSVRLGNKRSYFLGWLRRSNKMLHVKHLVQFLAPNEHRQDGLGCAVVTNNSQSFRDWNNRDLLLTHAPWIWWVSRGCLLCICPHTGTQTEWGWGFIFIHPWLSRQEKGEVLKWAPALEFPPGNFYWPNRSCDHSQLSMEREGQSYYMVESQKYLVISTNDNHSTIKWPLL